MSITPLKQELKNKLSTSDMALRKHWAKQLLEEESLVDYLDILLEKPLLSTRFSWLLGDLSSINNRFCKEIIAYGLANKEVIYVSDFTRVLAKQYCLAGNVSGEINEGALIDLFLQSLMTEGLGIHSIKGILQALNKVTDQYPKLKPEIKESLYELLEKWPVNYKQRLAIQLNKLLI